MFSSFSTSLSPSSVIISADALASASGTVAGEGDGEGKGDAALRVARRSTTRTTTTRDGVTQVRRGRCIPLFFLLSFKRVCAMDFIYPASYDPN